MSLGGLTNSLEATQDSTELAIDGAILISCKARVGGFPGTSVRGRQAGLLYEASREGSCRG